VQQEIQFPPTLRVGEILRYVVRSRPFTGRGLRAAEALGALELAAVANAQVGGLSGGQRRRLAVALGLVHAPDVVVLDEATANLDARGRAVTWGLVEQYAAAGGAAVTTSHLFSDVDEHADAVVVLRDGRVVLRGSAEDVRGSANFATVSFRVSAGREDALRAAIAGSAEVVVDGRRLWTVRCRSAAHVVAAALAADPDLADLRVSEPSVTESIETILERGS
jgi:ABC-2 type transport system ATP-binding protein